MMTPFDTSRTFGIGSDHAFIPFDTTGTVVHSESRVPTEWKKTTGTSESRVPTEWKKTTGTVVYLESRMPTERVGEDALTYHHHTTYV
jgi:hypothetical protein